MRAKRKRIDRSPRYNTTPEKFPGYPVSSPKEYITSHGKRVDQDAEDLPVETDPKALSIRTSPSLTDKIESETDSLDEEVVLDEYEVTSEDLLALGSEELNADNGDDESLKDRPAPVDFAAGDLDIPGTELDDEAERIGSEDEENNSYSLGGDRHDDLEENRS